jgi:hypothetical protein
MALFADRDENQFVDGIEWNVHLIGGLEPAVIVGC